MDYREEAFSPEGIDEQIEWLLQKQGGEEDVPSSKAQVVHILRSIYTIDPRIQRVREKLAEHMSVVHSMHIDDFSQAGQPILFIHTEHMQGTNVHKSGWTLWQYLSVFAACLIAALTVGSLVAVLSYRQQVARTADKGRSNSGKIATVLPFSGRTLYTAPADMNDVTGLSWSPDSRRVASIRQNTVQIWDATTGNHLVSVQMSSGDESPSALAWSAHSQQLAIATSQHILLVNSQTGQIELSYAGKTTAQVDAHKRVAQRAVSGMAPLVSQLPASGGFGFHSTAWSPDGQQMASAVSYGLNGAVEVWNPRTGAFLFGLNGGGKGGDAYSAGSVSWSSDGQYIAATMFDRQSSLPTQPNGVIVVWSAKTHQIVFQHEDYLYGWEPAVAWQPQSHLIAFGGGTRNTADSTVSQTLEIWDGVTGKLVKQSIGEGNGAESWSPDGRYLAYGRGDVQNRPNTIDIIEIATGKKVYIYNGDQRHVDMIAWSPDGQYIASVAGDVQDGAITSVWAVH